MRPTNGDRLPAITGCTKRQQQISVSLPKLLRMVFGKKITSPEKSPPTPANILHRNQHRECAKTTIPTTLRPGSIPSRRPLHPQHLEHSSAVMIQRGARRTPYPTASPTLPKLSLRRHARNSAILTLHSSSGHRNSPPG